MGEKKRAENAINCFIFDGNILPITSNCNTRCIFCSHRFNPPGVKVYSIPPRSILEIRNALPFIDPARPIVIGESATRIIEGEPLTHPNLAEILQLLRDSFPSTPVSLTTNGILLDQALAELLDRLGNITVNLSLNCIGAAARSSLLGVLDDRAVSSVKLLEAYGITFNGSIVAMPQVTGWDELEQTVFYLAEHGAETIRVFEPGFSRLAPPGLQFSHSLRAELISYIEGWRKCTNAPITCEPPHLDGLEAVVAGVLADSPARAAGLQMGDVIMAVNGREVGSRVEAFRRVLKAADPVVTVRRENGLPRELLIRKKRHERSGLVMDYDLEPGLVEDMARVARHRRAGNILILTSQLAGPLLAQGVARFWRGNADVKVLPVENAFFGGSIRSAGLLTVGDMSKRLRQYLALATAERPDLVLLPGLAFDRNGYDLTGVHYNSLVEELGIPAVTL